MNPITRQSLFLKFSSTEQDIKRLVEETSKRHQERYGKVNSVDTMYTMWSSSPMFLPTGVAPRNIKECISQAQLWGGQPKVDIICR